ncbi:sorting nexin-8-like isoform X2 [Halichondria panicea]|uniref:sorting nexin-8-like isoform X2 n=1 Tax=Halichondria panicea TaxID=6063 RepID=UPI00312B41D2
MAVSGAVGSVPGYYREVFVSMCPSGSSGREGSSSRVPREIWLKCATTASLPQTTLNQIWTLCDSGEIGSLNRDGLYKSLALLAIAQQGKAVDKSSLSTLDTSEMPVPVLGPTSELADISLSLIKGEGAVKLLLSYDDIKAMDDVSVTLIPEKKGMVFKHVEYLVESKELQSSVRRRYRDFEAFYDILIVVYPYRLVPKMPPKKLMSTAAAFIEQRRRALKRFLTLVVRHPVLSEDEAVKFFLTAGGNEVGARIKDRFKSALEEYNTHPQAETAEELVSEETRIKFERVQEQISLMHKLVSSMLSVAHNMESRSLAFGSDMKTFASNMMTLSSDSVLMSSWTSGSDDKWTHLQRDCHSLSGMFNTLSETAHSQGVRETSGFTESVNLFLDLISSYQDLCDRRDRTVHRKHQKALAKVHTLVNYKERREALGKQISEKDDGRIIKYPTPSIPTER